ncbi:zinc finger protein 646 [Pelodytes ibericus]
MDERLFGSDQLDGASDNPLSCNQCPSTFSGLSELESHLVNHKDERPFKCNLCDRSYRHAASLVNHKKTHQVGLYTCLICQKQYSNPMGLKNHLRIHSEDKRFKCDECGESFRISRQLSSHRKAAHGFYSATNVEDAPSSQEHFDLLAPVLVENSSLISNLENYIAESMVPSDFSQLVQKYYPEEKPQEATDNQETVKQETDEKEEQMVDGSTEDRRYKCKQCGKAYKHAGSLANHRQSHTVGVYQCAICFKEFTNLMAMKNHCRLHSDSRARKHCNPSYSVAKLPGLSVQDTEMPHSSALKHGDFMDEHALSEVSNSSHSEEENRMTPPRTSPILQDLKQECLSPLAMTIPDQADSILNPLFQVVIPTTEQEGQSAQDQKHSFFAKEADQDLNEPPGAEVTDEEEAKPGENLENRPFMCQECGKTYRHAGSLINHKKTHQTGVYSCSICSKQLFNMAALKNHLRAHFKSRAGRKLEDTYFHSASFSDELFQEPLEDPYQCVTCHAVLTSETDYLQHQALHQNDQATETSSDEQHVEEGPAPDICWGENLQGSSDDSAYSSGPGVPEAIKREVENLAFQPPLSENKASLEIPPADNKTEDPDPSFQDPLMCFDRSPEATMVSKATDSSGMEEPAHNHTADDRPYKCEACGRTYRHKCSLLNHRLTHKTGVYQCSLCPKQYPNLMALRIHLRFHSRKHSGRSTLLCGKSKSLQSRVRGSARKLNKSNQSSDKPMLDYHGDRPEGSECLETESQTCNKAVVATAAEEATIALTDDPCPPVGFESGQVKEHQDKDSESPEHIGKRVYGCDLCEKSYRHSGSLINHKRTHQTGDYACSVCSKHVHNLAALKNHLRIHHKVRREKSGSLAHHSGYSYNSMYFSQDNKGLLGCVNCEEVFQSEEDLVVHQEVHVGLERDPWSHLPEDAGLDDPQTGLAKEPGMTDSNDWEHSSSSDDYHKKQNDIVSPEKDIQALAHPCDECGEVCTSSQALSNHKHTHQTGIYQCSFCPKEYPNLLALRTHFQTHTKPQTLRNPSREILNGSDYKQYGESQSSVDHRYDCGHCGLVFSNESDFHQHQVGHESQEMNVNSSSSLHTEDHVSRFSYPMHSSERELLRRIKNEMEGEDSREAAYGASHMSHICGFCGKTYDDLESLEAHGLSHSNEKTSSAGEGQPTPEDLELQNTHLQQVKEEGVEEATTSGDPPLTGGSPESRPFTCDQCGKNYRHGGSLVNHKKTHLVGNFKCSACLRHFPNMAAYRNHLRRHPKCKQEAALANLHELHFLNPSDSTFPGEGEELPKCPSAFTDPPTNFCDSHDLQDTFKIDMDPLPNDTLSFDNPCSQLPSQIQGNNFETSRKPSSVAKCARKAAKRRRILTNHFLRDATQSTSANHPQDPDDKSVQICEFCGKLCTSVNDLVIHLSGNCESHLEKAANSLPTDSCIENKVDLALSQSVLKPKWEAGEPGFHQRPFRCEVCGRSYRHAGSLINHKQTHKTGIFQCSICLKRFFNLMAMKNHNRIHFELKRHKCQDCGKAFRLHKQLDTHQQIHRDRTANKKTGRRKRRGARSRKVNPQPQQSCPIKTLNPSPKEEPSFNLGEEVGECLPDVPRKGTPKSQLNPDSRPYQCEECGRSYRHAGSLVNHKKSHTTGQYCCAICDKTYPNLMAMKNHQRTHYESKRHHCSDCGKTFKWKRQFIRHQLVHAQAINHLAPQPSDGSEPLDGVQNSVVCEEQDKIPVPSRSKRRARKRARNINSAVLQHGLTTPLLSPSSPLKPICQDCGILFVSYNELENHPCRESVGIAPWPSDLVLDPSCASRATDSTQSHHTEDRPYQCNLCGRTYRHAGSLLNHKNTHKTGVYKCSICLKQFFNPMAIKNHLRTHTAEKRFQCLECGKAFRSSRELICHNRVHTGERPFHCPTCNRGFSSKLTLRHHQRSHKELPSNSTSLQSSTLNMPSDVERKNSESDPQSGASQDIPNHTPETAQEERRFKCNQCDRSYRHAGSLLNHRKTHSTGVYQCPDCHKEFFNLLALKNHLRIHRYPCTDCGKAFRIASHLATHRKIHEQGGPFTCLVCSKRFFCRSSFEQHQLTHDGPGADILEPQPVGGFMVEVT